MNEIEKTIIENRMETWKEIEDYPNYEISDCGNIRNKKTGRILKQSIRHQYYIISLRKNSIKKTYSVHRLVALAFIQNPFNKPCVDHINGNSLNNKLDNLRWASILENNSNCSKRKGTMGLKGVYKNGNKFVAQIGVNKRKKHIGSFDTAEEASEAYKKSAREHFGEFARFE